MLVIRSSCNANRYSVTMLTTQYGVPILIQVGLPVGCGRRPPRNDRDELLAALTQRMRGL